MKIESMKFEVPPRSNIDAVLDHVRAVFLKGSVSKITIQATESGEPEIIADMISYDVEPPNGPPPKPVQVDLWDQLISIPLVEHNKPFVTINLDSLTIVSSALLSVAEQARANIAWVLGDINKFMEWMNITGAEPTRFLNLPIIVHQQIPKDRLILLYGITEKANVFQAEGGISICMEAE